MKYALKDIVDVEELNSLCESYTNLTGLGTFIYLEDELIVSNGTDRFCNRIEIDCSLIKKSNKCCFDKLSELQVSEENRFIETKCVIGFTVLTVPIFIDGKHLASFRTGQFFAEKPDLNYLNEISRDLGDKQEKFIKSALEAKVFDVKYLKNILDVLAKMTEAIVRTANTLLPIVNSDDFSETKKNEVVNRNSKYVFNNQKDFKDLSNYKDYIDFAPDGVFIANDKGQFVDVNKAAAKLAACEKDVLIGFKILDLVLPEYKETAIKHFSKTKIEGFSSDEIGVKDFKGKIRYWNIDAVKISETQYLGFVKDITESKNIQNMYNMLADNVTDMITLHSNDGSYLYVSPAAKTLLGYKPSELIGKNPRDFFHPDDLSVAVNSFNPIFNINSQTIEYRIKCKDGLYRWLETNNKIVINPITKEVEQIICISRNIDESKKIQDELNESVAVFKAISDNSRNAICILNEAGRFVWANKTVLELSGYSDETITNAISFADFLAPESLLDGLNNFSKFLNKEQYDEDGEFYILTQSGEKRLVQRYMRDYVDKNGNRSLAVSMLDITDVRKSEQSLVESENKFRTLTDTSSAGVFIHNGETFDYFNKTIIETTGFSAEDLSLMQFIDLVYPDDRPMVSEYWKMRREGVELPGFYESRMRKKDGGFIWANISAKLIMLNGKPCLIGTAFDITQSKQTEEQLILAKEKAEENEFHLKKAQGIAHVGHWDWNVTTQKTTWSEEVYNILGLNKDTYEVTTESFKESIHPEDLAEFISKREDLIGKTEVPVLHHRILRPNGEIRFIEERSKIVRNENEKIIRAFGTIQDITDKKILEDELILAKDKAEESDRLKSSFLKNLSHEIRTPMNAIMGFSDFINEPDITSTQRKEYTGIITEACQQLLSIVTDVLTISSIDTGLEKVKNENIIVADLLKDVFLIFKNQAAKQNIVFSVKNKLPNNNISIFSDESKLKQIIANLIGNALKFTKDGFVEIGCEIKENNIEFYVKDSGIGIDSEIHEKIFERFRQADLSISRKYGGTGLGLSISKALVELLGGKIYLNSELGVGSEFYVSLPYLPINIVLKKERVINLNDISKGKTILIAEDEDNNFILLNELLKNTDNKIIRAVTGIEAVNIFVNEQVDFILMDLRMPDMSGFEATEMIRAINPDVPIVVQSAFSLQSEIQRAMDKGANEFIVKPVDKNILFEVINKYLF